MSPQRYSRCEKGTAELCITIWTEVPLTEGQPVSVYEYNDYADGEQEYLLADGVVELNDTAVNGLWCEHVKWCCRIDERGIRVDDGSIWP